MITIALPKIALREKESPTAPVVFEGRPELVFTCDLRPDGGECAEARMLLPENLSKVELQEGWALREDGYLRCPSHRGVPACF